MLTRCLFRASLVAAAALCATVSLAETTTGSLEPTTGTWRAYRGAGFTTQVCSANSESAVLACATADAQRRSATTRYQIRYPDRYVTATFIAPVDADGDGVPDSTDQCPTVYATTPNGCPATPPANRAPTIAGTPAATGQAGTVYRFVPSASDADGDKLTFAIQQKPRWATFNTATGELVGTPTTDDIAFHSDIRISVSDGRASVALPEFSISVQAASAPSTPTTPTTPTPSTGSASLSWTPSTRNTDGSSLTNLAGYRIAYGTTSSALTQVVQIANTGVTSYTLSNLSPGTYYFAVRAYTSNGTESPQSNVASKVVR